MKRIVLIISILLLFAFVLTSCSHEHSYGEWEVYKEMNCVDDGSERRYCKCGEEQTRPIAAKGHTIDEGVCVDCKEIFDPFKALGNIIKTEGKKLESSNTYSFPKESLKDENSKTFVSYDLDSGEMQVVFATTDILLSVSIDPSESTNEILMASNVADKTYVSMGYIYTNTFDIDNSFVHGFSSDAPNAISGSLEDIMTLSTRIALETFSYILNQSNTGITIQMLGFENIK